MNGLTPTSSRTTSSRTIEEANHSAALQNTMAARLMAITARPAAVMERGAGSYLWDESGKRYLDFIQGWAVNSLGHAPAEITKALVHQSQQLITPSPALHNRPQFELAALLTDNSAFAQVHFTNSGAEANEAAVKLARKWGQQHKPGAQQIITSHNAFHGRTLAMMAASGKPGWDTMYPPMPAGFQHVPFGDIEAIRQSLDNNTLAVMLEPIQGEAGVVVPPPGYLRELRALTEEHNLLLILDEVQTGSGRTGRMYGHEHESIVPDIMTLGKGIGGGVPLAAVLATEHACCFEHGNQGGTYNGNPLMAAVGKRVVETILAPGFLDNVSAREVQLRTGLAEVAQEFQLGEVRGKGLLYALELPAGNAVAVCDQAFELGLLLNPARPDTLRFMPSLRVSIDEVREMLELLRCALKT